MNAQFVEIGGYLGVLGLGRIPFPTTPDAACYFRTPVMEEELAEAVHCVMARKGFVLVTGEIGLGKSTLIRHLTDTVIQRGCAVSTVLNTFLHGADLLRAINGDFGIAPGHSFADDVALLNTFLVEQHANGHVALIVIDDAQNMCLESLELVRMLSNFETNQEKLVQILLCGQPELVTALTAPSIRQLTSRIVKHVQLRPLRLGEMRSYVEFRLTAAGADGGIVVTPAALRVLHRLSRGNPRHMHLILDRCLYGLVALRVRSITQDLVRRAAAESGMHAKRPLLRRRGTRLTLITAGAICVASVVAASILVRQPTTPSHPVSNAAATTMTAPAVAASAQSERSTAATTGALFAGCLQKFGMLDRGAHISHAARTGDVGAVRMAVEQQAPTLTAFAMPSRITPVPTTSDTCVLIAGEPQVLLWRPSDGLQAFVFGGQSDGIGLLQQRLARAGYYHYLVDGMAGPRTVAAIAAFQQHHQLVVTGYPDVLTRFVIAREPGVARSPTI